MVFVDNGGIIVVNFLGKNLKKIGLIHILFINLVLLLLSISYCFSDEPVKGTNVTQTSTEQADSVQQKGITEPKEISEPKGKSEYKLLVEPKGPQILKQEQINAEKKQELNQTRIPPPSYFQKEKYVPPPQKNLKTTQVQVEKEIKQEEEATNNIQVFPDEYSELDDFSKIIPSDNDVVIKTLEHAKQKYIQAKILIDKGDTADAAGYFEKAIEILNRLTSYPGIEQNSNFTDLAKSIMTAFENSVQSIENLDDTSPFFAVRDKLFNEIEISQPALVPNLLTIELPKDTSVTLIGAKPIIPEPKKVVVPLDENEEVLKNIAFLTAEGKKGGKRFFKKWLERTTKWFPMMRQIAAQEEVPEELIYLSMIESGLRPDAVSHSNAVGLWQFLRTTGQDYNLNDTPSVWFDERRDPEKSTRAGLRYLKDLHTTFNDWHLALAAYNCGPGRVRRTLRSYGTDSSTYWDIRDKLPKETQHYVPIYIAATKIALNPVAFGFNPDSMKFEPEYVYETYVLTEPVSLSVIAKCVDTVREAIQELNPELLRTITPPDVASYTIKIPKGKVQLFVANYSTLSPADKQPWIEHKVSSGESIAKIAREYEISRNEIATANGLPSYRSKVKAGTILKIPVDKDFFAEKKRNEEEKAATLASVPKTGEEPKDRKVQSHVVKHGESLYSIANKYGVKMTELRSLNNLPFDDDNINIGQKLVISNGESKTAIAVNEQPVKTDIKLVRHKVKAGETLHAIAENYNVSIDAIKATNNLKDEKILTGQMIAIEVTSGSSGSLISKATTGKTINHEVKPDETLGIIAGLYGVTEESIIKRNPDKIDGTIITAGTILKIEEPVIAKGSAPTPPKEVNKAPRYYTVKRGDTLSSLSRKFGLSISELQKRNKGLEADKLRVGQRIRIE